MWFQIIQYYLMIKIIIQKIRSLIYTLLYYNFPIFFEELFLAWAMGFHSFRAVLGPYLATVRQWSPHNVAVFAHDHFLGAFEQAVVMLQGNAVSFVAVVIFDCFTQGLFLNSLQLSVCFFFCEKFMGKSWPLIGR